MEGARTKITRNCWRRKVVQRAGIESGSTYHAATGEKLVVNVRLPAGHDESRVA